MRLILSNSVWLLACDPAELRAWARASCWCWRRTATSCGERPIRLACLVDGCHCWVECTEMWLRESKDSSSTCPHRNLEGDEVSSKSEIAISMIVI